MIPVGVKMFAASKAIDSRKGSDGLLTRMREAGSDLFGGAFYVVWAKRADRVKIVWWDRSAVALYSRRLEKAA
jgi:transposase